MKAKQSKGHPPRPEVQVKQEKLFCPPRLAHGNMNHQATLPAAISGWSPADIAVQDAGLQSPVGAETQHKRLVAPSLQRNGSQQRGVKIWRDEQRRAQREVPNTVGPVDGLILKRLIPETDDFHYQVGVYPHRWG